MLVHLYLKTKVKDFPTLSVLNYKCIQQRVYGVVLCCFVLFYCNGFTLKISDEEQFGIDFSHGSFKT